MPAATIPGRALDGWLKLARLPWEVGARFVPIPGWREAIDRTDATVRLYAGTMLKDDVLVEDAQRRQAAAAEREKATQLKETADRERARAQERSGEKFVQAQRVRGEVEERAAQQVSRVEADKRSKERAVDETARKQEKSVEKIAAAADKALADRARESRLEILEHEEKALAKEEEALTADQEQARLAEAAGRVKAARKGTG